MKNRTSDVCTWRSACTEKAAPLQEAGSVSDWLTVQCEILYFDVKEQMSTEQENGGVKRKVGITEKHLCLAGIFPYLIAPTPRRTRNTAAVAAQAHLLTTAIVLSMSLLPVASELLLCGRMEKQESE